MGLRAERYNARRLLKWEDHVFSNLLQIRLRVSLAGVNFMLRFVEGLTRGFDVVHLIIT